MAGTYKARVTAPDWESLQENLVTLQVIKAVGDDLAADLTGRIRRGVGSDGTPLPEHYVRVRPKAEPLPKQAKGAKAKSGKPNPLPMSVINQLRVLGGHVEKPAAGTDWRGYDNVIRYGKDTRPGVHDGHKPGDIYAYQWNTAEGFRSANYGSQPGLRRGVMVRDVKITVKQKADHWLLTVGPSGGVKTRKTPLFKLLQMSARANKEAQEGKRPRKWPSSYRMALLERLGRDGRLSADPSHAIGVLDPSDRTLSEALSKVTKSMLDRLRKAPVREVKP